MREIKFRAWDKDEKKMIHWLGLDITKEKGDDYMLIGYPENKAITRFDHDMILMQYTGLKDKNGKEIWQGDIAEAWSQGIKAIGEVRERVDGLWIIYPAWQKKKFWGLCPMASGNTTVTVIGNIYENPELIEAIEKWNTRTEI